MADKKDQTTDPGTEKKQEGTPPEEASNVEQAEAPAAPSSEIVGLPEGQTLDEYVETQIEEASKPLLDQIEELKQANEEAAKLAADQKAQLEELQAKLVEPEPKPSPLRRLRMFAASLTGKSLPPHYTADQAVSDITEAGESVEDLLAPKDPTTLWRITNENDPSGSVHVEDPNGWWIAGMAADSFFITSLGQVNLHNRPNRKPLTSDVTWNGTDVDELIERLVALREIADPSINAAAERLALAEAAKHQAILDADAAYNDQVKNGPPKENPDDVKIRKMAASCGIIDNLNIDGFTMKLAEAYGIDLKNQVDKPNGKEGETMMVARSMDEIRAEVLKAIKAGPP